MKQVAEDNVETREALAAYVVQLRRELNAPGEEWENRSLEHYLEALASWIEDCPGYFANRGLAEPTQPTWSLFAHMLRAATMYG
jgi:hypothetical protein